MWKEGKPVSKEEWLTRIEERERKRRVVQVLKLDFKKLPDIHRRSLETLCVFLGEITGISEKNLSRLWKHFKKDIEQKEAARGEDVSELRPYSVEDWRNLFNQLYLDD